MAEQIERWTIFSIGSCVPCTNVTFQGLPTKGESTAKVPFKLFGGGLYIYGHQVLIT